MKYQLKAITEYPLLWPLRKSASLTGPIHSFVRLVGRSLTNYVYRALFLLLVLLLLLGLLFFVFRYLDVWIVVPGKEHVEVVAATDARTHVDRP